MVQAERVGRQWLAPMKIATVLMPLMSMYDCLHWLRRLDPASRPRGPLRAREYLPTALACMTAALHTGHPSQGGVRDVGACLCVDHPQSVQPCPAEHAARGGWSYRRTLD